MLICFFLVRGWSTRNVCHQDKLSIKLFTGKSLKISGKVWRVCVQALHALGCCTTTTPHVTRQSPSMSFWQKKHSCGSSATLFAESQTLLLLFIPRLKNHLKGRHFVTLDNIQKSATGELKGILTEAFQHCYEWKQRLRRCVVAQGNYFEGDNLDL